MSSKNNYGDTEYWDERYKRWVNYKLRYVNELDGFIPSSRLFYF